MLAVTSATALAKASSLAFEGRAAPLILRTYCRAASCTSASVAGGSKLCRARMLRHILRSCPTGHGGSRPPAWLPGQELTQIRTIAPCSTSAPGSGSWRWMRLRPLAVWVAFSATASTPASRARSWASMAGTPTSSGTRTVRTLPVVGSVLDGADVGHVVLLLTGGAGRTGDRGTAWDPGPMSGATPAHGAVIPGPVGRTSPCREG